MRKLLLVVVLGSVSCALNVVPRVALTAPHVCADRLAPKLFLNPACDNGVCGYTCEPGRWQPPPAPPAPRSDSRYDSPIESRPIP